METGELQERRLKHPKEAESFYRELTSRSIQVRVGMEASGYARRFERLLGELRIELWIGDAAEIRTKRVRKQKTDRQDAQLILKLMLKDDFPKIWVPSWEAMFTSPVGRSRESQSETWCLVSPLECRSPPLSSLCASQQSVCSPTDQGRFRSLSW